MSVENKVIVITGASSGIGEASAKLLASKGAKIVLGARRADKLEKIVADIIAAGGEAAYAVTDVTKPADNAALIKLAQSTFGHIDVMFLNAGLMPSSNLSELHTDEWHRMVDVNLNGVLNGIAVALPIFVAQKSGQFITTSSVAGLKPYPAAGVYGATKFAVKDLMEVLRMESALEENNIRTTTLHPAAINTELLSTVTSKDAQEGLTATYKKYGITPDRIANAVLFAVDQPEDTNVSSITVGPTTQPW
ncbi:MAG: SDR family oxidoreductase [Oenococcus oeni]